MKYILTAGWDDGVADLTERLVEELADGKRVLWLTSGGSNTQATVQIMDNISSDLSQNLSVMLADERYGVPGHAQSNWAQLMQANFSAKHSTLLPVLQAGQTFEQATAYYNELAGKALAEHEVIIAQLGIGQDGHIAGIKPASSAANDTEVLVIGYQDPPLERLTLTFAGLCKVSAAYVFAFGNTKKQTLSLLQSRSLELTKQPAQLLKQLPEAYIYNDQVGEHD